MKKLTVNSVIITFYIVSLVTLLVFGILGKSFFAYSWMNSKGIMILTRSIIMLLIVVRGFDVYKKYTAYPDRHIMVSFYLLLGLVTVLRYFVFIDIASLLLLGVFYTNGILLFIYLFKKRKKDFLDNISLIEPIIVGSIVIMLLMNSYDYNYLNNSIWIPILISGLILGIINIIVYIKYFSKYIVLRNKKGEVVSLYIIILFCSMLVTSVSVFTLNKNINDQAIPIEVEILDKHISNGSRTPTTYFFRVMIDGEEKNISVPNEVYHDKNIGDTTQIQFYEGSLGYAYYVYEYYEN